MMEKFERNMCPTDYDYDDDFDPVLQYKFD